MTNLPEEEPSERMYWDDLGSFIPSPELLAALRQCHQSGYDWSNQQGKSAKAMLRTELLKSQRGRCAYCRRKISDETGKCEIDHILPKAQSKSVINSSRNERAYRRRTVGYPSFTYTVWNLVLTCKRCNTKKGTYDCRKDRSEPIQSTVFYNLDPLQFEWVHPFLHKYSEHINVRDNVIYEARNGSTNGEAVIRECKLDEVAAVEVAAREAVLIENKNCLRAIGELICNIELVGRETLITQICQAYPEVKRELIEETIDRMLE